MLISSRYTRLHCTILQPPASHTLTCFKTCAHKRAPACTLPCCHTVTACCCPRNCVATKHLQAPASDACALARYKTCSHIKCIFCPASLLVNFKCLLFALQLHTCRHQRVTRVRWRASRHALWASRCVQRSRWAMQPVQNSARLAGTTAIATARQIHRWMWSWCLQVRMTSFN
jgi:hypothetical protein